VGIITIDRPAKRNALDGATVRAIGGLLAEPPAGMVSAVLAAEGDHFSAGLDLSELTDTTTFEGVLHSRSWHRVFDGIELGTVPVVSVLKGAVIGGGLELAATTHIRVAERSAFYAFPEGARGIFVGGGGSVRVPRLIGAHRMADMMLTGRVFDAEEGHRLGISHYLVDDGEGLDKALALAARIAENALVTNYAVLQALPRIQSMGPSEGLFVESLMAAVSQGSAESKELLRAFLAGRSPKVTTDGSSPKVTTEQATAR
jgi:enoyl-CoA hydratase/carnithine racemase